MKHACLRSQYKNETWNGNNKKKTKKGKNNAIKSIMCQT